MKRSSTSAERRYLARVAQLGCMLCRHLGFEDTPAEVHHVRIAVGWGRDGHGNSIGLCPEHHRGKTGVHSMGRAQFAVKYGISEIELLARVQQELQVQA